MPDSPPFHIFVHLPKTGGTSLRIAAAAHFGWGRVLYDYGRREKLTSPLVVDWIYDRKDPEGLARAARAGGYRFLTGHFPVTRYREVFPEAKFLTWMREPTQRVWSAYRHYRRNNGFEGSLRDFYTTPEHRNVQARFMASNPGLFDFIGVLEHNGASLERLADDLGIRLRERRTNQSPQEHQGAPAEKDWREITRLNEKDRALYARVTRRYR